MTRAHLLASPPMVLPDGHTLVGTAGDSGAVVFAGPNGIKLSPVTGLRSPVTPRRPAPPMGSPWSSDRSHGRRVRGAERRASASRMSTCPASRSRSAAASRTHLFVSTASALYTYDADGHDPAGEVRLARRRAVAAGDRAGRPRLRRSPRTPCSSSGAAEEPFLAYRRAQGGELQCRLARSLQARRPARSPQPASQTYQPPLTRSGKRLYACQDLTGTAAARRSPPASASSRASPGRQDRHADREGAGRDPRRPACQKKCKVFEVIVCAR